MEPRSDEEKIIEGLILEGLRKQYEDLDFLPIRQSLYNIENVIPEYDDEVGLLTQWARPHVICENCSYFSQNDIISVAQGNLPDENFIGALMAISLYPKRDLIQNIFASRPDDFKRHGIYTCRFYVDGEWVEVVTDTNIPCLKAETSGIYTPVYSRSADPCEMWIAFAEKAYAKAVGCYEAIPKIRIPEAFIHLTGGSVQQLLFQDDTFIAAEATGQSLWKVLKQAVKDEVVLTALPLGSSQSSSNAKSGNNVHHGEHDDNDVIADSEENIATGSNNNNSNNNNNKAGNEHHYDHFLPNRLYSIILVRETVEVELILMHSPWYELTVHNAPTNTTNAANPAPPSYHFAECWTGEWSNRSADWDLYPELLQEFERDPEIPWRRRNPRGYFWMPLKSFRRFFHSIFFCRLFPDEKYKFYCHKGEWRGRLAAGPLTSIRDKSKVVEDAQVSKTFAAQKNTVATIIDGDCNWFNNPQLRISLVPTGPASNNSSNTTTITSTSTSTSNSNHSTSTSMSKTALRNTVTHPSSTTAEISISLIPLNSDVSVASAGGYTTTLSVTKGPKGAGIHPSSHLWEGATVDIVACTDWGGSGTVKPTSTTNMNAIRQMSRGQEVSIWNLKLDPKHFYHVVPNTGRRGQEGAYVLRIFSSHPILVENVPSICSYYLSKSWHRSGDIDSTGGPLFLPDTNSNPGAVLGGADTQHESTNALHPSPSTTNHHLRRAHSASSTLLIENPKWGQNPQFHVDLVNPYASEDIFLKVIVRRTDKGAGGGAKPSDAAAGGAPGAAAGPSNASKNEMTVGVVVCQAELLDDGYSQAMKKKQPRQNAMGEIIPLKESSLRKKSSAFASLLGDFDDDYKRDSSSSRGDEKEDAKGSSSGFGSSSTNTARSGPTILRKTSLSPSQNLFQYFQNTFSSRSEATIFFPSCPRSWWRPGGLLIIPSLSEKGVKGSFELEIHCSEELKVKALPDIYTRSLTNEWTESTAGGCHLSPHWKKNPKFSLRLKQPGGSNSSTTANNNSSSSNNNVSSMGGNQPSIRIQLNRAGLHWKSLRKRDPVGTMMGFYVFLHTSQGDLHQLFESPFVPSEELVVTESTLQLEPLKPSEEYLIMPCTYGENKCGSFILTISMDCEFIFTKEKT